MEVGYKLPQHCHQVGLFFCKVGLELYQGSSAFSGARASGNCTASGRACKGAELTCDLIILSLICRKLFNRIKLSFC